MNEKSNEIIEILKKSGIKNVTLGFSTGKDSIVGYDLLVKSGINVIPIYFYICPNLDFIENNIKIYEDYFKMIKMNFSNSSIKILKLLVKLSLMGMISVKNILLKLK